MAVQKVWQKRAFNESHIVLNAIEKNCQLEAENAALRERLGKAVELPFVPSDYHIETWLAEIKESCVDESASIVIPCYVYIKCQKKEDAVARLAKLQGENA